MSDRWVGACRRVARPDSRTSVFDPVAADLEHAHVCRLSRAEGWLARGVAIARWRLAVLAAALECRLRRPSRPRAVHVPPQDHPMRSFLSDVRTSARRLRRQPFFVLVVTLTLALGIGANVAVFSYVSALMLTPLPVPDARDLVRVASKGPAGGLDIVSYPNYADTRDRVTPGVDLAAHVFTRLLVGIDGATESRPAELVTGNYFRVLRLAPAMGRLLDARDDVTEGAHAVVVIGERFWRGRLAADPQALGRTIDLNGHPYVVVGIVPETFAGAFGVHPVDLWAPVMMQQELRPRGLPLSTRNWGWLQMIGRLAPGTTIGQAQASLDSAAEDLNRRLRTTTPLAFAAFPAVRLPEAERRASVGFVALAGVFTTLLLIVTCANLTGVLQARLIGRRRELAIRQSLGAGRGRLAVAWLTECAWLGLLGGATGLGVVHLATRALGTLTPPAQFDLPVAMAIDPPTDWRVLLFAASVSIVSVLLLALMPALRPTADPVSILKEESGTSTDGRAGLRLRRASVIVQVAVSAVLLLASGLLATSLRQMQQLDPGFRTDRLAIAHVNVPGADAHVQAFTTALLDRMRATPGVVASAVTRSVPLEPGGDTLEFRIPGFVPPDGSGSVLVDDAVVSADYFRTLGLAFVRGTGWDATEGTRPAPTVAVVNETMARRFWRDGNPIGASIMLVGGAPVSVVGVVRDSAYYDVGEAPMPFVYLPAESVRPNGVALMVRTTGSADAFVPTLTRLVSSVDPGVVPTSAITFEAMRQATLYPRRLAMSAAGVFAVLSLVLTGVGLFGVISTSVGQRTRELALRVALGARRVDVVGGVLRETAAVTTVGIVIGLVGGFIVAGLLERWLFGVPAFDIVTYAGAAAILAALALLAAWVPARRAASIDPAISLKT